MSLVPDSPDPSHDARPAAGVVWSGSEAPAGLGRTVVTIGVFDGVHRGHQVIVGRAVARARAAGVPCVVVTFDPHPGDVLGRGGPIPKLTTLARRCELLLGLGADAVWVLPFSVELSERTAEEFVADLLVAGLHPLAVVVGANFHFGHKAAGRVETLRELGLQAGFEVEGVELVGDPSLPVWSSTSVRAFLASGDVSAAAEVLGRPHRVEGEVVHGDHRGRELGYPTANLAAAPDAAVPADGVYAGWMVRASGERLPAAVSVGTNPTFDGGERRVEAYVLDHPDAAVSAAPWLDLYGERVGVDFAELLRPMLKFDSVDELVGQMAADVELARARVGRP
jgi:riboflavin kinase / FMN adenylyltransferase